ncbi:MAG: hypothetical protein IT336_09780, partial [Thermomicrobiales bacterium]|nr:hypothetical protein [Thermomicrobiales bacterium]
RAFGRVVARVLDPAALAPADGRVRGATGTGPSATPASATLRQAGRAGGPAFDLVSGPPCRGRFVALPAAAAQQVVDLTIAVRIPFAP